MKKGKLSEVTFVRYKFSGSGQREVLCLDIPGVLLLIDILQGRVSVTMRSDLRSMLTRVQSGDFTTGLDTEDVPMTSVQNAVTPLRKRTAEDYDPLEQKRPTASDRLAEALADEAEAKRDEARARARKAQAEAEREIADTAVHLAGVPLRMLEEKHTVVARTFPDRINNDRSKLRLGDLVDRMLLHQEPTLYANFTLAQSTAVPCLGDVTLLAEPDSQPLSVSDLVRTVYPDRDHTTGQLMTLGKAIADAFRTKHGMTRVIQTHDQLINGRTCQVKHYTYQDHTWIGEFIRNYQWKN